MKQLSSSKSPRRRRKSNVGFCSIRILKKKKKKRSLSSRFYFSFSRHVRGRRVPRVEKKGRTRVIISDRSAEPLDFLIRVSVPYNSSSLKYTPMQISARYVADSKAPFATLPTDHHSRDSFAQPTSTFVLCSFPTTESSRLHRGEGGPRRH